MSRSPIFDSHPNPQAFLGHSSSHTQSTIQSQAILEPSAKDNADDCNKTQQLSTQYIVQEDLAQQNVTTNISGREKTNLPDLDLQAVTEPFPSTLVMRQSSFQSIPLASHSKACPRQDYQIIPHSSRSSHDLSSSIHKNRSSLSPQLHSSGDPSHGLPVSDTSPPELFQTRLSHQSYPAHELVSPSLSTQSFHIQRSENQDDNYSYFSPSLVRLSHESHYPHRITTYTHASTRAAVSSPITEHITVNNQRNSTEYSPLPHPTVSTLSTFSSSSQTHAFDTSGKKYNDKSSPRLSTAIAEPIPVSSTVLDFELDKGHNNARKKEEVNNNSEQVKAGLGNTLIPSGPAFLPVFSRSYGKIPPPSPASLSLFALGIQSDSILSHRHNSSSIGNSSNSSMVSSLSTTSSGLGSREGIETSSVTRKPPLHSSLTTKTGQSQGGNKNSQLTNPEIPKPSLTSQQVQHPKRLSIPLPLSTLSISSNSTNMESDTILTSNRSFSRSPYGTSSRGKKGSELSGLGGLSLLIPTTTLTSLSSLIPVSASEEEFFALGKFVHPNTPGGLSSIFPNTPGAGSSLSFETSSTITTEKQVSIQKKDEKDDNEKSTSLSSIPYIVAEKQTCQNSSQNTSFLLSQSLSDSTSTDIDSSPAITPTTSPTKSAFVGKSNTHPDTHIHRQPVVKTDVVLVDESEKMVVLTGEFANVQAKQEFPHDYRESNSIKKDIVRQTRDVVHRKCFESSGKKEGVKDSNLFSRNEKAKTKSNILPSSSTNSSFLGEGVVHSSITIPALSHKYGSKAEHVTRTISKSGSISKDNIENRCHPNCPVDCVHLRDIVQLTSRETQYLVSTHQAKTTTTAIAQKIAILPYPIGNLLNKVGLALIKGRLPKLTSDGTSGTYLLRGDVPHTSSHLSASALASAKSSFPLPLSSHTKENPGYCGVFKPYDEEPSAPNNPRGHIGEFGTSFLKGIRSGESYLREAAAYTLDMDGFHDVPTTVVAHVRKELLHQIQPQTQGVSGISGSMTSAASIIPSSSSYAQEQRQQQRYVYDSTRFVYCGTDDMFPTLPPKSLVSISAETNQNNMSQETKTEQPKEKKKNGDSFSHVIHGILAYCLYSQKSLETKHRKKVVRTGKNGGYRLHQKRNLHQRTRSQLPSPSSLKQSKFSPYTAGIDILKGSNDSTNLSSGESDGDDDSQDLLTKPAFVSLEASSSDCSSSNNSEDEPSDDDLDVDHNYDFNFRAEQKGLKSVWKPRLREVNTNEIEEKVINTLSQVSVLPSSTITVTTDTVENVKGVNSSSAWVPRWKRNPVASILPAQLPTETETVSAHIDTSDIEHGILTNEGETNTATALAPKAWVPRWKRTTLPTSMNIEVSTKATLNEHSIEATSTHNLSIQSVSTVDPAIATPVDLFDVSRNGSCSSIISDVVMDVLPPPKPTAWVPKFRQKKPESKTQSLSSSPQLDLSISLNSANELPIVYTPTLSQSVESNENPTHVETCENTLILSDNTISTSSRSYPPQSSPRSHLKASSPSSSGQKSIIATVMGGVKNRRLGKTKFTGKLEGDILSFQPFNSALALGDLYSKYSSNSPSSTSKVSPFKTDSEGDDLNDFTSPTSPPLLPQLSLKAGKQSAEYHNPNQRSSLRVDIPIPAQREYSIVSTILHSTGPESLIDDVPVSTPHSTSISTRNTNSSAFSRERDERMVKSDVNLSFSPKPLPLPLPTRERILVLASDADITSTSQDQRDQSPGGNSFSPGSGNSSSPGTGNIGNSHPAFSRVSKQNHTVSSRATRFSHAGHNVSQHTSHYSSPMNSGIGVTSPLLGTTGFSPGNRKSSVSTLSAPMFTPLSGPSTTPTTAQLRPEDFSRRKFVRVESEDENEDDEENEENDDTDNTDDDGLLSKKAQETDNSESEEEQSQSDDDDDNITFSDADVGGLIGIISEKNPGISTFQPLPVVSNFVPPSSYPSALPILTDDDRRILNHFADNSSTSCSRPLPLPQPPLQEMSDRSYSKGMKNNTNVNYTTTAQSQYNHMTPLFGPYGSSTSAASTPPTFTPAFSPMAPSTFTPAFTHRISSSLPSLTPFTLEEDNRSDSTLFLTDNKVLSQLNFTTKENNDMNTHENIHENIHENTHESEKINEDQRGYQTRPTYQASSHLDSPLLTALSLRGTATLDTTYSQHHSSQAASQASNLGSSRRLSSFLQPKLSNDRFSFLTMSTNTTSVDALSLNVSANTKPEEIRRVPFYHSSDNSGAGITASSAFGIGSSSSSTAHSRSSSKLSSRTQSRSHSPLFGNPPLSTAFSPAFTFSHSSTTGGPFVPFSISDPVQSPPMLSTSFPEEHSPNYDANFSLGLRTGNIDASTNSNNTMFRSSLTDSPASRGQSGGRNSIQLLQSQLLALSPTYETMQAIMGTSELGKENGDIHATSHISSTSSIILPNQLKNDRESLSESPISGSFTPTFGARGCVFKDPLADFSLLQSSNASPVITDPNSQFTIPSFSLSEVPQTSTLPQISQIIGKQNLNVESGNTKEMSNNLHEKNSDHLLFQELNSTSPTFLSIGPTTSQHQRIQQLQQNREDSAKDSLLSTSTNVVTTGPQTTQSVVSISSTTLVPEKGVSSKSAIFSQKTKNVDSGKESTTGISTSQPLSRKWKTGSLQEFVRYDFEAHDVSCSKFPVEQVHKIAILDLRLMNIDRNDGNILIQRTVPRALRSKSSISSSSPGIQLVYEEPQGSDPWRASTRTLIRASIRILLKKWVWDDVEIVRESRIPFSSLRGAIYDAVQQWQQEKHERKNTEITEDVTSNLDQYQVHSSPCSSLSSVYFNTPCVSCSCSDFHCGDSAGKMKFSEFSFSPSEEDLTREFDSPSAALVKMVRKLSRNQANLTNNSATSASKRQSSGFGYSFSFDTSERKSPSTSTSTPDRSGQSSQIGSRAGTWSHSSGSGSGSENSGRSNGSNVQEGGQMPQLSNDIQTLATSRQNCVCACHISSLSSTAPSTDISNETSPSTNIKNMLMSSMSSLDTRIAPGKDLESVVKHALLGSDVWTSTVSANFSSSFSRVRGNLEYRLIPIDHGMTIPEALHLPSYQLCWMSYPQVHLPLSPETLAYVSAIDVFKDIERLRASLGKGLRETGLAIIRSSSTLLKAAVLLGFTLYEIGSMVCIRFERRIIRTRKLKDGENESDLQLSSWKGKVDMGGVEIVCSCQGPYINDPNEILRRQYSSYSLFKHKDEYCKKNNVTATCSKCMVVEIDEDAELPCELSDLIKQTHALTIQALQAQKFAREQLRKVHYLNRTTCSGPSCDNAIGIDKIAINGSSAKKELFKNLVTACPTVIGAKVCRCWKGWTMTQIRRQIFTLFPQVLSPLLFPLPEHESNRYRQEIYFIVFDIVLTKFLEMKLEAKKSLSNLE